MYTENICVSNVYAGNCVTTANYQPVQSAESAASAFQDIICQKVNEAEAQQQACSATPAAKPDETEHITVNNYYPPPSVHSAPPPDPTAPFSIDNHYPITEDDVIPEIRKVRHIISNTDLSAKTDVEKYDWIENRFKESFGDDFMMARSLNLPSSMFYMIGVEFNDTLNKHMADPAQTNRARLYGDSSADAVQDKIREKYPEELTNKDLFLMVHDMRNSGVLDADSMRSAGANSLQRIMDTLDLLRTHTRIVTQPPGEGELRPMSMMERDRLWMGMLNEKADGKIMQFYYNRWACSGMATVSNDVAPFIVKYLDGVLNADGRFVLPPSGNREWGELLSKILGEFDEYDELIRSRMALIDAEEYSGASLLAGDGTGVEAAMEAGEGSGVDGDVVTEESYGAEENHDSEDTGDSDSGAGEESSQQAA